MGLRKSSISVGASASQTITDEFSLERKVETTKGSSFWTMNLAIPTYLSNFVFVHRLRWSLSLLSIPKAAQPVDLKERGECGVHS